MIDREKGVILEYLCKLVDYGEARPSMIKVICSYLQNGALLQRRSEQRLAALLERTPSMLDGSRKDFTKFMGRLKVLLRSNRDKFINSPASHLEQNLGTLAYRIGISPPERDFLGLMMRYLNYSQFHALINEITENHIPIIEASAVSIGVDTKEFKDLLHPRERFMLTGIVQTKDATSRKLFEYFEINNSVSRALLSQAKGLSSIMDSILHEPLPPMLPWEDFEYMGDTRKKVETFIRQALQQKQPGINILIWGRKRSGKTDFCKLLAEKVGAKIFEVKEDNESGAAATSKERIGHYRIAQNLLRYYPNTLVMIDEMNTLLEGDKWDYYMGRKSTLGTKTFASEILDNNSVPTIWISNEIEALGETFIRRMSLVVEIKTSPPNIRENIVSRALDEYNVNLPPDEIRSIVHLNLSPESIDKAARFANQIGGGSEDFRFAAQEILRAIKGGKPTPPMDREIDFRPELTHADLDLSFLTSRLITSKSRSFSLCLYGPPGTGKSAYLRHLGKQLKMPILFKRASDLIDKYVGESEKNIAAAFQEALDREAILIFDEADSLLGDRRNAQRNWEVSQVNEMLTWMERHPLPFACTTNLWERLDHASLRRFTFKCCFDYMRKDQVEQAFQHFFGQAPPRHMLGITSLTPGDFMVVCKKIDILECKDDLDAICHLLRAEVNAKQEVATAVIGFQNLQ